MAPAPASDPLNAGQGPNKHPDCGHYSANQRALYTPTSADAFDRAGAVLQRTDRDCLRAAAAESPKRESQTLMAVAASVPGRLKSGMRLPIGEDIGLHDSAPHRATRR